MSSAQIFILGGATLCSPPCPLAIQYQVARQGTSIIVVVHCTSTAVIVVVVGDRAACTPKILKDRGDSLNLQ